MSRSYHPSISMHIHGGERALQLSLQLSGRMIAVTPNDMPIVSNDCPPLQINCAPIMSRDKPIIGLNTNLNRERKARWAEADKV